MVKFIFIIAFLVISPQLPVPLQKRGLSRFAPSAQKRHTARYPRGEVILALYTKASKRRQATPFFLNPVCGGFSREHPITAGNLALRRKQERHHPIWVVSFLAGAK